MPQDLAQRSASSPEDVQIAGMDVLVQGLLHLQGQRAHSPPHIRVTQREPHSHTARDRDHRAKALMTAAAMVGDAEL